jgi:leucine-zipper-like transcriptional regulator 1
MFIFGGHDGSKQLNDFFSYDFKTKLWTEIVQSGEDIPAPRDSHILINYGDSIFLFGGSTGNPWSDFYEFKIQSNEWSEVIHQQGVIPTSWFCHVGVVIKNRFYIFGGYNGDSRLNDFHYFLFDIYSEAIPPSTLIADVQQFVSNKRFSDVDLVIGD